LKTVTASFQYGLALGLSSLTIYHGRMEQTNVKSKDTVTVISVGFYICSAG